MSYSVPPYRWGMYNSRGDVIKLTNLNFGMGHIIVVNPGVSLFDVHSYWNTTEVIETILEMFGLNIIDFDATPGKKWK